MAVKTVKYSNINLTPALTWNWLKMNRAALESEVYESDGETAIEDLPDGVTLLEQTADSEVLTLKGGSGDEAQKLINELEPLEIHLKAAKDAKVKTPVIAHYTAQDKSTMCNLLTLVAEENSDVTLIMDYASVKDASGLCAIQTKVLAKPYSHVHIVKVQMLGKGFTHIDDLAIEQKDGALVEVTQLELGSDKSYAGVQTVLSGYEAKFKSNTAYLTTGSQLMDLNYSVIHTGEKTDCNMMVKGVVGDSAKKVYRGTINFKNGCHNATGNEQEETLLISPEAVNKSIPVILCDEEEVSGTHGSTIGRLSDDELFYMQSRGISESAAKKIMSRAKVASIAHLVPDETTVNNIEAYIDGVFDHE